MYSMRKVIASICAYCCLVGTTSAQEYKEMMYDYQVNFYDVVKAAEDWFSTHGTGKGSGYKGYARWKAENESKYFPTGDRSQVDSRFAETSFKEFIANNPLPAAKKRSVEWTDLGPYDANNITSHYSPGIGRVEALWVNPSDEDHLYLGSRSGGFWRTTDGGKTWDGTTDFLTASGVNAIAVRPTDPDDVFINVRNASNGTTHGIYSSTNGGKSWTETKFNPDNLGFGGLGSSSQIYKIVYHPRIANLVFVGTSRGLFRSEDDLDTWTQIQSNFYVSDIEFHPTDNSIVYIFNNRSSSNRGEIWKSTDGGKTFSSSDIPNNNQTGYIAVSPAKEDYVYFASTSGIWKSTDKGDNFTFLINPDENCRGFAVSDKSVNNMVYGYVDLETSNNEGKTFWQSTKWNNPNPDEYYVHADLRVAECVNGNFYIGTDGYLCKSEDGGSTWERLNDGTGIRENYAVGVSQSNWQLHMVGSQDNGTSVLTPDGWLEWSGGDGMEALIRPLNDDWMMGSFQYGNRQRTTDGAQSRQTLSAPEARSGDWIAPLLYDPNDQMRIYHFMSKVYVSNDFGTNWETQGEPDIGKIQVAAIAENNSAIMAFSRQNNLQLSTDQGKTFTSISAGLAGYSITDIAFDPKRDSTILVVYNRYQRDGRKVYISHDLGQNWENISYNLQDMPIRSVTVDRSDSSIIYLGAEIGVFAKSMKSHKWELYNNKLPNVSVRDLEIQRGSNTLKAATWGRGLWEAPLLGKEDYPSIQYTNISQKPSDFSPKKGVDQKVTSEIAYDGKLKTVTVWWSETTNAMDQKISMSNTSGNIWESDSPIPSQEVGTNVYFKVVAEGSKGDITETAKLMYTVRPFDYCDAAGATNTGSDYITSVILNDLDNTSGKDSYGDFTSMSTTLKTGETYTLKVGMLYHFAQDNAGAWIDYNADAEFTEDEMIKMSEFDVTHKSEGTFTVPTDAKIGASVRMRVRSIYWDLEPVPCGTFTGEVEDYTILIEEGVSVTTEVTNAPELSISPNPSHGDYLLQFTEPQTEIELTVRDLAGKVVLVKRMDSPENQLMLHVPGPNGVYLMELSNGVWTSNHKLVKE